MKLTLIIIALFTIASSETFISVGEIKSSYLTSSEAEIVTEKLRMEVSKINNFRLVNRDNTETAIKEQKFQLSGMCNNNLTTIESGNMLIIQYSIICNIWFTDNSYTLNLKVIDLKNGETVVNNLLKTDLGLDNLINTLLPKSVKQMERSLNTVNDNEPSSSISISSIPKGASVIVGNQFIGDTPIINYRVPSGTQTISIGKNRFYGRDSLVTLLKNSNQSFHFFLTEKRRENSSNVKKYLKIGIGTAVLVSEVAIGTKINNNINQLQKGNVDKRVMSQQNFFRNLSYIIGFSGATLVTVTLLF